LHFSGDAPRREVSRFEVLVTSVTGLLLLVLRQQPWMGVLLIVHLGFVLTLFLTLPYGKFVHGFYRAAALLKYWRDTARGTAPISPPNRA
jgi:citrate/tricarballylate utilization protein